MLYRYLFTLKNVKTKFRVHNLISVQSKKFISNKFIVNSNSLITKKDTNMDSHSKLLNTAKSQLLQLFEWGVCSVLPGRLVRSKVNLITRDGPCLEINDTKYPITDNVYLVGFGKAVAGMARELEHLLGARLKHGILSIPRSALGSDINKEFAKLREEVEWLIQDEMKLRRSPVIEYYEGAENNQPDEASLATTERIVELVRDLGEADTLLVLISGGGSALLFQPRPNISAQSKRELCQRLQNAGASINKLNCLRKLLSDVKGGGLAKIAYPAQTLAFVLSDVVGDPLDTIASGPTYPADENKLLTKAVDILNKFDLYKTLEDDIKNFITKGEKNFNSDVEMIEEGKFKHVENIVIGNNTTALEAAAKAAEVFDLQSIILSNTVQGNVINVSYAYTKFVSLVCSAMEKDFENEENFICEADFYAKQDIEILNISRETLKKTFHTLKTMRKDRALLLLAGGEPTVKVEGNGKGGRNQELALRFSMDWLSEIEKDSRLSKYFVIFLSAGTDGQDGPTDATGAFGTPIFYPKMIRMQKQFVKKKRLIVDPKELEELDYKIKQIEDMLPNNVLNRNDTYNFYSKFENAKYHVKTGLTGTNVMDLHFIYIKRRDCGCVHCPLTDDVSETFGDSEFLFDKIIKTEPSDGCPCIN